MKILINKSFNVFVLSSLVLLATTPSYASSNKLNDSAITAAIKLKETSDPLLNPFKINVTTQDGVVRLKGQLDTNVQFERAVAQANAIENVKDVDVSNLKVKASKEPLADTIITAKIKGKLLQSKLWNNIDMDSLAVKVETKNQNVFLVGEINSNEQRHSIIKIAKSVKNVKSVDTSGLKVIQ